MAEKRTEDTDHRESYARSLIEASLDPFVTIDSDGKIMDVNAATEQVTGIPRKQLIGTDFSDYFTDPAKAREGYQAAFSHGFVRDYPLTIARSDGQHREVLYNASVYRDARGNIAGVFAAARDVTETNRLTKLLAEKTDLLDNILRSTVRYSIIALDLDRNILSWNEGARVNLLYTEDEVLGKSVDMLHSPEDVRSGLIDAFFNEARTKGMAQGEFVRIRRDGTRYPAYLAVTRDDDSSGTPVGFMVMGSDMTEQKEAEERLVTASQNARSLIEASLDPLVTISSDGTIMDVNEATIRATGVPRERLIGTDFCDYFTDPERARQGYQQVFASGFVTDYPLTIRHRDGTEMQVLYNASVYRDVHGAVQGVFAAARDVTVQRKAEAEIAAQRRRELDRLAELERFQQLTVGRELRMIELKKEIEELRGEIEQLRREHASPAGSAS